MYTDGTKIASPFTMTRLIWTVEPTDASNQTIIYSNAGNVVSAIIDDRTSDSDTLINGTVALEFLPGQNVAVEGEVGVLIRVPRDQLVDLEHNFRDSSVILQLNDGFTNLRSIDITTTDTQNDAHLIPGEGPTMKAKVTQSQFPLDLSLQGNAMSIQIEAIEFESIYIHSRNSMIELKGDILEDDGNRIIGGNANICPKGKCGDGLKVVIEGSIKGTIELSDLNGFERGEIPDEPTMKLQVHDPTGTFSCDRSFFQYFSEGLGPGIECSTTTETVTSDPPFPCTMTPRLYLDVLVCPVDKGPTSTPEDETCECTVVPPSQQNNSAPNGSPSHAPPTIGSSAYSYSMQSLVMIHAGALIFGLL